VTSESNEMMVVFKSNFSNSYHRGFQAVVTAGKSTTDFCSVFFSFRGRCYKAERVAWWYNGYGVGLVIS